MTEKYCKNIENVLYKFIIMIYKGQKKEGQSE